MPDTPPAPARRRSSSRLPLIAAGGALVALHGALWLYFRARQPATDEQTRQRLQPRSRA